MEPTIAAYLAGLMDGEGTFSIARRPTKKSRLGYGLQPYIEVGSTDQALIEWVRGHMPVASYGVYRPRSKNDNARDCFCLQVTGMQKIIDFCIELAPYLVLKRPHALVLMEYCRSRLVTFRKGRFEREFTEHELELFQELRRLNWRGRKECVPVQLVRPASA